MGCKSLILGGFRLLNHPKTIPKPSPDHPQPSPNHLVGWMDDWMDGWLVDWMDDWMVGWLIGPFNTTSVAVAFPAGLFWEGFLGFRVI